MYLHGKAGNIARRFMACRVMVREDQARRIETVY